MYHANPGKLDALHARFRDHTCVLFKKHGMELVGFWIPAEGPDATNTGAKNTLYYILAFPSAEAAEEVVAGIPADPEWTKVKAESERTARSSTRSIARTSRRRITRR